MGACCTYKKLRVSYGHGGVVSFPLELKTTFFSRLLGVNSVSGGDLRLARGTRHPGPGSEDSLDTQQRLG